MRSESDGCPAIGLNFLREWASFAPISLGVIVAKNGVPVVFGVRCRRLWGLVDAKKNNHLYRRAP